jgi:cell division protein ZapA
MAATVSISIVGRPYDISCDEGQEDYIRHLAGEVDRRAVAVLRSVGPVGDARLLVMVALVLADEIGELRSRQHAAAGPAEAIGETIDEETDSAFAVSIETLARRIDAIAEKLERT